MRVVPLQAEMVAGVRSALLVLTAAVGFVLLIATANIANLLLTRGAGGSASSPCGPRSAPDGGALSASFSPRACCSRSPAAALASRLAFGLQQALPAISPANIPRLDEVALDGRVLAFASFLSLATGLLFGLVPAMQGSRVNVVSTLNEAGIQRMGGFRFLKGNRLRGILVIVEVALSTVLLAGGALLVRSFIRLVDVNPGYDPANVITAQVGLPETRYGTPGPQSAFFDQLLQRVAAIPGVQGGRHDEDAASPSRQHHHRLRHRRSAAAGRSAGFPSGQHADRQRGVCRGDRSETGGWPVPRSTRRCRDPSCRRGH